MMTRGNLVETDDDDVDNYASEGDDGDEDVNDDEDNDKKNAKDKESKDGKKSGKKNGKKNGKDKVDMNKSFDSTGGSSVEC